jgi:hypothetical protein
MNGFVCSKKEVCMKHSGKLPPAVVGELMHIINNALGLIILNANQVGGEQGAKIEARAFEIANYVKSLGEKEEWNSNPFDREAA